MFGWRFLRGSVHGAQAEYFVFFGVGIEMNFLFGHGDGSLRELVKLPRYPIL